MPILYVAPDPIPLSQTYPSIIEDWPKVQKELAEYILSKYKDGGFTIEDATKDLGWSRKKFMATANRIERRHNILIWS